MFLGWLRSTQKPKIHPDVFPSPLPPSPRSVYEDLVAKGVIVPAQEVPPPTVPMDYSWARVGAMGASESESEAGSGGLTGWVLSSLGLNSWKPGLCY